MRSCKKQPRWLRPSVLQTLLLAMLFTLRTIAFGQSYFGTVSGELTDPSGAVVPGASVVLKDEEKGYQFNAKSDNAGHYLFVSIPPGLYTVTAEAKGFEKIVRTHVRLNVTENATANLVLKIASTAVSVDVKAQTQTIDVQDAVTGEVIDRRAINDLPLVDRYAPDLLYLTPGVTDQSDQNSVLDTNGTNFISNGSRGASADILMDGSSVTNFEPNGGITYATYIPSPEAIDEFKVQQSNFSAEYGFSGASIVNMITRSGTNTFHGEVYDFARNTITDANNWFNNEDGIPIPPVHRQNFGGTIGGPIIKNKTFFFFDFDATRQSTMSTYYAGVPSTAERTGDFGEICGFYGGTFDSNGNCSQAQGQIWDPYSGVYCDGQAPPHYVPPQCPTYNVSNPYPFGAYRGTPIPYNNIATYTSPGNPNLNGTGYQLPPTPGNLIDPVAQKMMNLFPAAMPNVAGGSIYYNWITSGASSSPDNKFDIRIDHRFNEKNLLSGKYSQEWTSYVGFNCFGNFVDPCGGGANQSHNHLFSINETYTISPTLLLTSTLGFTRGTSVIDAYNSSLNSNPLSTLGFPSYLEANGFNGVPAIFIGGGYTSAGYTSIGDNPYGNYRQGQDTGQLSFVLNKIHHDHDLKFGVEGRLHQQNYIQTNAPLGNFAFNDTSTGQNFEGLGGGVGGDGMASFMMGQMLGNGNSAYELQFRPATENYQYALFVQDNWKVRKNLTLNLGLRYDVNRPRTERHNRMNWFDPSAMNPLNGGTLTYFDQTTLQETTLSLVGGEVFASPSIRTNWRTDWKDIQPRFGFAYQYNDKMVIRGGYGIYYSQTRSGANGLLSYGSQGFNQYTSVISTYNNDGATPYLHLSNPFPNGFIPASGSSLGLLNDVGYGAIGPLRTIFAARTPYEQEWTFGFQRQLGYSVVIGVDYIGKKGTHLYFSGNNNYDILGPEMETNSTLLGNYLTYVNNPFSSQNGGPISDPNSVLSAPTVQEFQLNLPYPEFTSVTTDVPPTADSIYHGVQITAEKHFSNGLEFLVSYTWSKSIDDSSMYDDNVAWLGNYGGYAGYALQDPNKPSTERALSTFDIPQVLKFSYSYDIPLGRNKTIGGNMPRVLDAIIGGWKTNGIWQIRSGWPIQFFANNGGTPLPTYGPQRPDFTANPVRTQGKDVNWVNNYFANPQVIEYPAPYTLGNAGRTTGSVRTPHSFSSDLSIAKQFLLSHAHEGIHLEMRLEAQNAFNHPVLGTPDSNAGDPDLGQVFYQANTSRQCQLAAKIVF